MTGRTGSRTGGRSVWCCAAPAPVLVRTRPGNAPARRLAETLGLTRHAELDADGFVVYASGW